MLVAGAAHFIVPGFYERLIPRFLGPPGPWVYGSGVAEMAGGMLLTWPRTRRVGALWTAAVLVLVFPGNVNMALDDGSTIAWLRLPLQVPLVWWAWRLSPR